MKVTDKNYYMDGYKNAQLSKAKEVVSKDWDMVFLYDGLEGSGKSVCAMQDAYFCDPTLTLERVCFNDKEFKNAVENAEKFQAIIYDEAFSGLSSREAMTHINRSLIKMLAEIRQKNLFIFVVMPTFFDLDKYVALWRSRALIHVYTGDNFQRGFFAFYNIDKKKDLFINGKKFYSYKNPKPNFIGRFTNAYPLDEEAYKKKKYASLTKKDDAVYSKEVEEQAMQIMWQRVLDPEIKMPNVEKIKLLQTSPVTFYRKQREFREQDRDFHTTSY